MEYNSTSAIPAISRRLISTGRALVRPLGATCLALGSVGRRYRHVATPEGGHLFADGFETGSTRRFRHHGNPSAVNIVSTPERDGLTAARFSLDHTYDLSRYRTEIIPQSVKGFLEGMFARLHQEYSYSFGMFLPEEHRPDEHGDCFAQWHGIPNRFLGEAYRHAPVLIALDGDHYFAVICSSSRLVTPSMRHHRDRDRYDRFVRMDLGSIEGDLGRWVDWTLQVRWSYQDDGMGYTRILKDGHLLVDDQGPNCFNDWRGGPYLKLGIYKWDWEHLPRSTFKGSGRCHRFFDSIRIRMA